MGFFDSLIENFGDMFEMTKYLKNEQAPELDHADLFALNVGAINAEQIEAFYNCLTTGKDVDELRGNLEDYYDITDRDSAIETIQWFIGLGHRGDWTFAVREMLAGNEDPIAGQDVDPEQKAEMLEQFKEYCSNVKESFDELKEEGFITDEQDLYNTDIVAWDMGRMVTVTRCAFDCGYITEEEAWQVIHMAARACGAVYGSWKELATGYIVGRAMWSGSDMMLTGLISITQGLLEDEESPWKKIEFIKTEMKPDQEEEAS